MIRNDLDKILESCGKESLKDFEAEKDRLDLRDEVINEAWIDKAVTGNTETGGIHGSYYDNEFKSAEALVGNRELVANAFDWFEQEDVKLGSGETASKSAEFLDVMVRCSEICSNLDCVFNAVDNVINSPDKQVEKEDVLETDTEYNMLGYSNSVNTVLEEYITNNIDDILNEVGASSKDGQYVKEYIENNLYDKITVGTIDLPDVSEREILHHLNEAFNNELVDNQETDYTVSDFFRHEDVADFIKEKYAEKVAVGQLANVLENTYDKVIQPAIEQKETEQDLDRD